MRHRAGHDRQVWRSNGRRFRVRGIGGRKIRQRQRRAGGHSKREHGWDQGFHGNDPNGIDENARERAARPTGGGPFAFAQGRCLELSSRNQAHDRTRICDANTVRRVWEDVPNGRRCNPRACRSGTSAPMTHPRDLPMHRCRRRSWRHGRQWCSSLRRGPLHRWPDRFRPRAWQELPPLPARSALHVRQAVISWRLRDAHPHARRGPTRRPLQAPTS